MADATTIGTLIAGAGTLIVSVSTFNTNQGRKLRTKVKFLTKRNQALETQVVDCTSHIFELEQLLAKAGAKPPARPISLNTPIDDEEDIP
jgi:hypothetical protein